MTTELVPLPDPEPTPPATARADLVTAWLGDKKPSTVEGYRKDLNDFARWTLRLSGGEAVEWLLSLSPGDANSAVLAYRNDQLNRKLSSATIGRRLAAIRSVVKLARSLGRVNWTIEVAGPPAEARLDMRGPNPDEFRRVLKVLRGGVGDRRGRRDRAAVFLMYGMGLRRGEVVALHLAHVDFPTSTLKVVRKGKREPEVLTIPEPAAVAVESWVVVRGAAPGSLFGLSGSGLWRAVSRLGKAAGLARGLWPHAFRHAATTAAESRTEKDFEVMAFTGHAKPQTAARYLDRKREAQARVARLVAKDLK